MECQSCPLQPVIDAFVRTDNLKKLTAKCKHKPLIAAAHAVQPSLSAVCLACAQCTDDDNPSNQGQSFVSLDNDSTSDDSRAASRSSHRSSPPQTASVADYLISRRRPDVHALDPHGCTTLPPDIEETLKRQFANFASLSPMDLCLVAHLMAGGSFATFASMTWLPHLPYDPQTLQPIPVSRQAVHARFRNIVRKMPVLSVIAKQIPTDPSDTHTKARRFSNISAIGRSNSRLAKIRSNPVIQPSAAKRTAARHTLLDSVPPTPPSQTPPCPPRPPSRRKAHEPPSSLIQLMLF